MEHRAAEESLFRKWGTLIVLSLALAIILIDSTLLNVALSTLIRDLHTTLQKLQWVISAYSLILAALTVTGGRMGDLFGRKRMFIAGAITFVAGAIVASMASSFGVLLLGESIIEGIGAALMMPATASLLVAKYRGHERAIAFGIWGAVAAAAAAIGPILGGFLTTHYSWRWGFRINIFVVALLLLGSPLVEDDREPERTKIDWLGVVLSAAGLFLVVFGIIESESYGWFRARKPFPLGQPGSVSVAIVSVIAGAVIVALFIAWERRFEARGGVPIVSMALFTNRQFVAGAGVTGVMMLGQNGVIFCLPVFLQSVRQLDALYTGLMLLPLSIMILFVSPTAANLTKRIAHKRLVQAGLICNTIAILMLRATIGIDTKLAWLVPALALYGIGMGLVLSQINNLTLSAVPVRNAGEASGVTNTFRQIGIALGTAIIGAVLISSIVLRMETAVQENASIPPQTKDGIAKLLVANSAELVFGDRGTFDALPPATRDQMTALRRASTTAGIHRAFLWCAFFALAALGVSTFLPLRPDEPARERQT
jgi:EmrB/QacA subfamily drug resistance transporter